LAAAIGQMDMFSWLNADDGANTEALHTHFDLTARPADVLLTLCRANGFIITDDDRHSLTPLAREYLVKDSPWNLRPYYTQIQDTPIAQDFLKVLRTGKPANWQPNKEGSDWHASMQDEKFANDFTDLMNCRGLAFGQKLAEAIAPHLGERSRLLDIGGGSGIYASTMVAAHPQLTALVLEQSPVDAIARKEVEKHGLKKKIDVLTANMFEADWPEGCDLLLLSNVLHDWDFPEVRMLLKKSARALPTGGLLVIHEAFINDDKTGPLAVAEYSALLMNFTQGKCYTPLEYGEILAESGFEVGEYQDTIADRGFMTAVKR
jgi:SAM-dependent methyltransferase